MTKSIETQAQEILETQLWPEKMDHLVGPILELLRPLLRQDAPKNIVKWRISEPDEDCHICGGKGYRIVPDGHGCIEKEPCDCMYLTEEEKDDRSKL